MAVREAGLDRSYARSMPKRRKPMQGNVYAERSKGRKAKFLEAVEMGCSYIDACAAAGWAAEKTWRYHRDQDAIWGAKVQQAKAKARTNRAVAEGLPDSVVLNDFPAFTAKYFPDRRPHQLQQLRMAAELENLRPREICLFLIWPEAGKTSTEEDYISKKLALEPTHRFRVISEGTDLSKRIVGTVKRRMTDPSDYAGYISRFGPFYQEGQEKQGKPWTTDQITLAQNPGTERDRNLVASGWTSTVYGSRIDTLLIDDVQTQRNYGQAADIFRVIRGTFLNRGIEMRTLICGTRIGPGDFYERLLDAGLVTKLVNMRAADIYGEPTVPEFWDKQVFHDGGPCCAGFRTCPNDGSKMTPREYMELIRHQSGEEVWQTMYQQNPGANERTTFAEYVDGCLDHDRVIGQKLLTNV